MKVCASSQADVLISGVLAIQLVFSAPFHMAYESVNLYFFVCLIWTLLHTHTYIWLFSIRMVSIFFNYIQIVFLSWTTACSYVQGDIHSLW